MEDDDRNRTVHVSITSKAYTAPSFIIERDGRYYVTLAVLDYDPDAPDITPEQREGVAEVEKLYRSATRLKAGVVELERGIAPIPVNTLRLIRR